MAKDEPSRLSLWIHERTAEGEVRISAHDADGWIDRTELTTNIDTFDVECAARPHERYKLLLDKASDELRLEQRLRLVFDIVGVNEDQRLQQDGVQILVEVPEANLTNVPLFDEETFTLPASVLTRVDREDDGCQNYNSVRVDRVAGLEPEKRRIVRFLKTGTRQWGLSEPTGIILEGPPGTGKTELVMEICQEMYGSVPVTISGPEILSKWVGESERLLREKFEETLESRHRILYIDELDAIARTRTESSQDYTAQLVSQLLVLLDGIEAKGEMTDERPLRVMASTNIAHVIDPALRRPGRLGNRPVHIGRPSEKERVAVLHHYLENVFVSSDGRLGDTLKRSVTDSNGITVLRRLARQMEGFSGADIEDVVQETVGRTRDRGDEKLTSHLLEEVLQTAFSRPDRYRTREFTASDLPESASEAVSRDRRVVELPAEESNEKAADRAAKQYFREIATTAPDNRRYVFRLVTPGDLLANDSTRTRERTSMAFQHTESERLCVYLSKIDTLAQAQKYSSLVRTVLEVLNEQLIQWHEENLLLVEASDDTDSLLCFSK